MDDVTELHPKRGRGPGRPFKPGESGNPAGRTKMPEEFHALAKAAAPEALQLAIRFVRDEAADPRLRLQAAQVVMDRAYGKPQQSVGAEVSGPQGAPLIVTVAELMAMADKGK